MLKKAIHRFNRATIIALEIAGMLAIIFFFAWLGLVWRLSQGPLELGPFVTNRLQSAFHEELPDFTFTTGRMQLVWGGHFQPFEFEMQDLDIARADRTPVLSIERLRIELSKRNLVFGRIVPRVIHLYGPELRVIRQEDGRFTLNVSGRAVPAAPQPEAPAPSLESREALIRSLLEELRKGAGILGGLKEIDISDAAVRYEDKVLDVSYLSTGSDVTFARAEGGMVATAAIGLDMGMAPKAAVRATVAYSWEAERTTAAVVFTQVIPAYLAQQSEQLKELSEVAMPFKGSLNIDLDPEFRPSLLRFALGAEAGTFNALGLYAKPVNVTEFYAKGDYDIAAGTAKLEQLKVGLGGPAVEMTGSMKTEDGLRVASVSATLTDMPMDKVETYWPLKLTPEPRWWVTTHLSKGTATKATLELEAAYDPTAKKISLRKLGGDIDYNGIRVNYFPPLEPVLDAAGTAHYDAASFNLDINAGKLQDMTVTKSVIHITGLDKIGQGQHANIDIAVALNGPLKTALKVLDSEPLKYPALLGIKTANVGGNADVDVSFKFPIHRPIPLEEVKVKATAKLNDVQLSDMVAGMDLTGGPMELTVDNGALKVKGAGKIGGLPLQFDWVKNFSKKEALASRVGASLTLDAATLLKFGVPKDMDVSGKMPTELTYAVSQDKTAELGLKGDIKALDFTIPEINFQKQAGLAGGVTLKVMLRDGKPYRLSGIDLKSARMAAKGDIDLAPGGGFQKLNFRELALGDTNISLQAENHGRDGYDVRIAGRQLDASPLFRENNQPHADAEVAEAVPPLRLSMTVERLLTGKDKQLNDVRVNFYRNGWSRMEQLQVDAVAGGKAVSLQYMPQGGGHTLRFEADNAGQALSMLGLTNSIKGGKLVVEGKPRKLGGPRDMAGTAVLQNFRLNDAPVVAKLLNALSLGGIVALLNGEGLSFEKAKVNFSWTDRGQPAQFQNVRLLKLSDGQTSGASLGLTFEGSIDQWKNVYNLKGTIVPVSDLSKILNGIPIIGTVLTAGGEGIIAATYTVTGPKEKPEVMVNPLSVLAPGMLRKIFFEN